jgi:ABC-2 type transport system ATP-binding protein
MSKSMIRLEKVAKSFAAHAVLTDVSLEIPEGQTFALLGRNGAGKTTLIRIMLGLIPADAGTVQVAGLDPGREAVPLRSQVGYLAEDQIMYGWMTPLELCGFLAPFYAHWDMDWARASLERFSIPCRTKIRQLSKGQSVKLGLVAALAHRPRVVILDDPAMGLDPIARKEFNRDLVEHLQTVGCTVLYSSHLLGEVEAVADAVAILEQGRILRTGTTDQLRDEVKRVLLPMDFIARLPKPERLLDMRRHQERVALVIDESESYLQHLRATGINFDVTDLSLDEIFEAFVIGRAQDWPERPARVSSVSA